MTRNDSSCEGVILKECCEGRDWGRGGLRRVPYDVEHLVV